VNLGWPELIILGAVALLVFGPSRLPELAKSLGKSIRDFKKGINDEDETKPSQQAGQRLPPQQAQPTVPDHVSTPDSKKS
jgi:sec-independent protein translocase protein TatA